MAAVIELSLPSKGLEITHHAVQLRCTASLTKRQDHDPMPEMKHITVTDPLIKSFGTDILQYFHHRHHSPDGTVVETHHCGRTHVKSGLDYLHDHCKCGRHAIDRLLAVGHDENLREVVFKFTERCPLYDPKGSLAKEGPRWHIESGTAQFYLDKEHCAFCGKKDVSFPCVTCNKVFYCSDAHRKEDFAHHEPLHREESL